MNFLSKQEQDFTISFKNIDYQISNFNKKTKQNDTRKILNNITGCINSGEIAAIMGPSGSGKSSLLNFLNDRIEFSSNAKHSGQVYVNNTEISFSKLAQYSSYVMQDDVLFDILTPKEIIQFVYKLRENASQEQIDKNTNTLLEELKLTKCKDTYIGSNLIKGISGGEKKRTSIGVELISNPTLVFLDEPTSGLDSQTSKIIIEYLQKIALEKNKLIICTIHQPSSNIFHLFNKLFILNNGNMVYNGSSKDINTYFSSIGRELTEMANPADSFMLKLEEGNDSTNPLYFSQMYEKHTRENIEKDINNNISTLGENCLKEKTNSNSGFCSSLGVLVKRSLLNIVRNPQHLKARIGFTLIFLFIIASVWWMMEKTPKGLNNRIGYLFFLSINLFMSTIFGSILAFPVERGVFIREYASNLYSIPAYYISKNLVEIPFLLIASTPFLIGAYLLCGMRIDSAEYIFINLFIFLLHSLFAQGMGYCIGVLLSDLNKAMAFTNLMVMPFMLFSGVFINPDNMPRYLFWFTYVSPFFYTITAVLRNEVENNPNFDDVILEQLGLKIPMWTCAGILFALGLGFRILGGFLLKLMVKKTG